MYLRKYVLYFFNKFHFIKCKLKNICLTEISLNDTLPQLISFSEAELKTYTFLISIVFLKIHFT